MYYIGVERLHGGPRTVKTSVRTERGFADVQLVPGGDLLVFGVVAGHPPDQQVDRRARDLGAAGVDRGQAGGAVAGLVDVVEPGQRDVVGDPDAVPAEDPKRAQGEGVVQPEDRVELEAGREQPLGRLGAGRAVPATGREGELGRYLQAVFGQGLGVRAVAEGGGARLLGGVY